MRLRCWDCWMQMGRVGLPPACSISGMNQIGMNQIGMADRVCRQNNISCSTTVGWVGSIDGACFVVSSGAGNTRATDSHC